MYNEEDLDTQNLRRSDSIPKEDPDRKHLATTVEQIAGEDDDREALVGRSFYRPTKSVEVSDMNEQYGKLLEILEDFSRYSNRDNVKR